MIMLKDFMDFELEFVGQLKDIDGVNAGRAQSLFVLTI